MKRQLYFIWTDKDGLIWKHCQAAYLSALFFQTHNADLHPSALTPIVEQRNRTQREPGFLIVSDKMGCSKEQFPCNPLGILQNFTGASSNIFALRRSDKHNDSGWIYSMCRIFTYGIHNSARSGRLRQAKHESPLHGARLLHQPVMKQHRG